MRYLELYIAMVRMNKSFHKICLARKEVVNHLHHNIVKTIIKEKSKACHNDCEDWNQEYNKACLNRSKHNHKVESFVVASPQFHSFRIYPAPRTVWISFFSNPLSILFKEVYIDVYNVTEGQSHSHIYVPIYR